MYFQLILFELFFLSAQAPESREYQIEAAFLYNFSQFVEWPADAFPEAETPLVIGVLGDDPFGNYLVETVIGEKANGHPLTIQHYKNIEEIKICHILFINLSEANKQKETIEGLKGRSILTVSDVSGFLKQGGMIRFAKEDNKIRIRINPDAAKEANLVISSKLLRIAEIVESK